MKRLISLFILIAINCIAMAEVIGKETKFASGKGYVPFLDKNKKWYVWHFDSEHYVSSAAEYVQPMGQVYITTEINDTVIGDNSYTRMYCWTGDRCFYWNDAQSAFMSISTQRYSDIVSALFREEDGKVYKYDEGKQVEYLFYDFTLEIGDEFSLYIPETGAEVKCTVKDIDKVTASCRTHRRLHLATDNPDYKETIWIEGYGSEAGPLVSMTSSDVTKSGTSYLAHARSASHRYAQPFNDTHYRGQELQVNPEPIEYVEGMKGLEFEFIGDVLHITGNMRIVSPVDMDNLYMYCVDSEDGALRLGYQILEDYIFTEMKIYGGVDLYFPGLKPGYYNILTTSGEQIECKLSADAVTSVNLNSNENSDIFTLQGTKLAQPQKGLNIIGGKKVLVR